MPAAIRMPVVGGLPVGRVVVGVVGIGVPLGDASLVGRVGVAAGIVRVGDVGEGGRQERDRRACCAVCRQHVERQPVLARVARQMQHVATAAQPGGDGEGEAGGPAAILDVVAVEVDRGVILRGVPPARFLPGPAGADHAARRQVDRGAVAALRPGVGDGAATDALRKIPRRQDQAQRAGPGERVGEAVEPAGQDRRVLDTSVQVRRLLGRVTRGDQHRAAGGEAQARMRAACRGGRARGQRMTAAMKRLLPDDHGAGRGIGRHPHPVPPPQCERQGGGDGRAVDLGHCAMRADGQGRRPIGDHRLHVPDQAGPHQRGPGAGRPGVALRAGRDGDVGAEMDRLAGALERLVEQIGPILVAPARPLRVRVGADHAQQPGAVGAPVPHADMRHDGLAGPCGQAGQVAGDR